MPENRNNVNVNFAQCIKQAHCDNCLSRLKPYAFHVMSIITARNSSCRKVMFSQASVILGRHTALGRHPLPLDRHPLAEPPPLGSPAADIPQTAVDGTHPTGMHSCSMIRLKIDTSFFSFQPTHVCFMVASLATVCNVLE